MLIPNIQEPESAPTPINDDKAVEDDEPVEDDEQLEDEEPVERVVEQPESEEETDEEDVSGELICEISSAFYADQASQKSPTLRAKIKRQSLTKYLNLRRKLRKLIQLWMKMQ
jgi:hypothetical protein